MTRGLTRREGVQDSLAGRDQMQPVQLRGPGIMNPTPMRVQAQQPATQSARVAQELANWSSGRLAEAVQKQQQRDLLDGQMAHIQGETFDQVEMQGRPWALEGYRLMDAQSMASSMLAAQRQEIAQMAHQMTPDQFRAHMADRVASMTEGMDPRTAELVQAQMVEQMPTLFADHTQRHLQYQEQQAFDSLERSIDVVSRDPTSVEQLVAFAAGGEDSPSAGLSDERRTTAVVSGIVRAFDNDNPLAYSAIMGAGVLDIESLPSDQIRAIRSAQSSFQSRRRQELNVALLNEEQALMDDVEAGNLSPGQAVESMVDMYSRHGIEITHSEATTIYGQAEAVERTENYTATVMIEEAMIRQDWDAVAAISSRALHGGTGVRVAPGQSSIAMEGNLTSGAAIRDRVNAAVESVLGPQARVIHSSGFRNNDTDGDGVPDRSSQHGTGGATDFQILRPDGSVVMWDHPEAQQVFEVAAQMGVRGFGAGPTYMGGSYFHLDLGLGGNGAPVRGGVTVWSDDDGGASDRGPGAAQWYQSLVNAASGSGGLSADESAAWSEAVSAYGGNIVHAGIAFEFGEDAVAALEAGTAPAGVVARAEEIQGTLDNWRAPTAADRLELAQAQLNATRQRNAMDVYEQITPQLADLDDQFVRNEIDEGTWIERRQHLFGVYDQARTEADVDHEIRTARQVDAAAVQAAQAAAGTEYELALDTAQAELVPHRLDFEEAMADETLTTAERQAAAQTYMAAMQGIFDQHGIEMIDRGRAGVAEQVITRFREGEAAHREYSASAAMIGNAETANTVGSLPSELQNRALDSYTERLQNTVANVAAENPDMTPAQLGALEREARMDYIARNNIVDPEMQQMVNLAASGQGWISRDGTPNPSVVAGLHTFTSILAENPDLAYQYVPDPEARGRMMAASFMVQTQFPDMDVFSGVDLADRNDPVANAFHAAVEQVGLAMDRPATPQQTGERVSRAVELMERGNITGSWLGGAGARNVAQALIPNSLVGAGLSSRFDTADVNAARGIDDSSINYQFQGQVTRFLEEVMPYMPAASQQGAVTMALDYVRDRGAVMGSSYIMPRENEPSIRSQMFPGQSVENTAAVNTAIVQWMKDDATLASNPILSEAVEGWLWDSTPQFTVHRVGETYSAIIPGYGSVALPLREIGDLYLSTR